MELTVWRFQWDFHNWSLAWRTEHTAAHTAWQEMFALRCALCRAWSLGCSEHWLCGLCEPCKMNVERDETPDSIE